MKTKTITIKAAALCLTVLSWGSASAQVSRNAVADLPALELTLEDAVRVALDENPTIKIADLEIERQKYVRRETVGNHLPSFDVSGQYSRAIVKSEMGGGVSFDPDNQVSFSGSLIVPLFAPGVYKTLKLNDEQMRAAVESARGSKITLVNEVKKAYYGLLMAEESLRVLKTSEQTVTETVEDTRMKYESGLASEYDYITANVQLSNLKPNIIQTENSIEVSKKFLKMYMGLPLETDIVIKGDLNDFYGMISSSSGPSGSDISGNSDLRSLEIQTKVLEKQLQVARTQRMPTLSAFGSLSLAGRDPLNFSSMMAGSSETYYMGDWVPINPDGSTGAPVPVSGKFVATPVEAPAISNSFMWMNPISVGLQLSIPIFSGLTKTSREKQLKNTIRQTEMQRDYLAETLNVQAQNAYNEVITAEATMNANEVTIGQAQKGYDISRTRYDAGMGTMLEVNSAELNLTQAKLNYTQAIYDYLSSQADYDKVLGKEEY